MREKERDGGEEKKREAEFENMVAVMNVLFVYFPVRVINTSMSSCHRHVCLECSNA